MKTYGAQRATTSTYQLAEGPVWDAVNDRLLWVDISNGDVHEGRLTPDGIDPTASHHVDCTVGAVATARGRELLVAGHHAVYLMDADGVLTELARPIADSEHRRFNDGKCDAAGRFLVGTLALGDEVAESLYRIDSDGEVTVLDDDLQMSNGLAWSPDGNTLYSVDTTPGIVWRRDYDAATGACGEREIAFRVTDGSPDGMCVDAEGNIWLAVWGPGQVRQFSPAGEQLAVVTVDSPYASSVTFAGADLDTLVITTAIDDLTVAQRAANPHAGSLFLARVDVTGLPANPWQL